MSDLEEGTREADAVNLFEPALDATLQKAILSENLADVERALNLVKLRSDIQKTNAEKHKAEQDTEKTAMDTALAARQQRHALISSMLAPLIPLASLATVVVTLFVSYENIRLSQEQAAYKSVEEKAAREETSWKAFVDDIRKSSPDSLYSNGIFIAQLREFATKENRKGQIFDITKQFMLGLSSASAFEDTWKIAFKSVRSDNFEDAVALARGKKQQFEGLVTECKAIKFPVKGIKADVMWDYVGVCSPNYSVADLVKQNIDTNMMKLALKAKDAITNNLSIQGRLSEQLAAYLRQASSVEAGPKVLDLSNITLLNTNLDDVDFSQTDLRDTVFDGASVKGAVLLSRTAMPTDFRAVAWWEARTIDQKVLPYLIRGAYPENALMAYWNVRKISREEYQSAVDRLCTGKMISCQHGCLRFGSAPAPVPAECDTNQ